MRAKERVNVAAGDAAEPTSDPFSVRLATIAALLPDGTLHVDLGEGGRRMPARLMVRTSRERVETAIALQQQVVILFQNGDCTKPIIMGFIERLDAEPAATSAAVQASVLEADVDGTRVRVTAKDEIVLQCGSASITLRRNGRVVVRGTYVETHSDGTNRIKGGQVQIN